MHFKRLEIFGFKSFPDRTVLNFEPGVTAIVGPNGVGKSNIADAIKWVLGEQSARELRGFEMQDVIFNGTNSRLAVGLAEVSLTLSNQSKILPIDYEEVTVTRRIFRSGESQYLLNKTPCRLKDITELFMGTGLGANTYSMIGQGKIGLIIGSKPEERRFIFDEAAGITKYKSKKNEALRKLEQTENNLLRANDIVKEVKRQISSIERQAKKAQRYKELFDRLKEAELKVATLDYRRLKEQIDSLEQKGGSEKNKREKIDAELETLAKEMGDLNNQSEETEARLLESRKKSIITASTIERYKHQIPISNERIEEIDKAKQAIEQEIEAILRKTSSLKEQIERQNEEIGILKDKKDSGRQKILKGEGRLSEFDKLIKTSQQKSIMSKSQIMDMANIKAKSKNESVRVAVNLQNASARHRRLNLEKQNVEKEKASLAEKLLGLSRDSEEIEAKLRELQKDRGATAGRLEDVEKEMLELSNRLNVQRTELQLKTSKKEFLEDLENVITRKGELIIEGKEIIIACRERTQKNNLTGHEIEIHSLKDASGKLEIKITRDSQEYAGLENQAKDLKKKKDEFQASIHATESEKGRIENEKAGRRVIEQKLDGELSLLTVETEDIASQIQELEQKKTELEKTLTEIEKKDSQSQDLITTSQDIIASKVKEREEILITITKAKAEALSVEEREKDFLATLEMLKETLNEQGRTLQLKKQQITDGEKRKNKLGEEIEDLKNNLEKLNLDTKEINEHITELDNQCQGLKKRTTGQQEKFKEKQDVLEKTKTDINGFNLSQTEIIYQANAIRDRINQAYKVELDTAEINIDDVDNWGKLRNKISELKNKTEAMGMVNLVAIDEHRELKERFSFLTNQKQDLENAQDSLYAAIKKINRTTRKLFLESFEKIQSEFRQLFTLLFEGGDARLLLNDQNNILESGVEIIARPPGKKLQSISLLSGGEKALTAIALLFAIFRVKPSPFCVLDEIDAPLDEANIDRFTGVLNDFVKTSQFIIITHSKKTITMADVMYGVTMEESGVSKLVSVKLAVA